MTAAESAISESWRRRKIGVFHSQFRNQMNIYAERLFDSLCISNQSTIERHRPAVSLGVVCDFSVIVGAQRHGTDVERHIADVLLD
jgi:hypothetical protein